MKPIQPLFDVRKESDEVFLIRQNGEVTMYEMINLLRPMIYNIEMQVRRKIPRMRLLPIEEYDCEQFVRSIDWIADAVDAGRLPQPTTAEMLACSIAEEYLGAIEVWMEQPADELTDSIERLLQPYAAMN